MFIKKSIYQWSTQTDCWYVYSTIIKHCQLVKEACYIAFVVDNVSVIINQGSDNKFNMITKGYSIKPFSKKL